MDAQHWDRLAPRYDGEVFSVLDHDRLGLISQRIADAGGTRRVASDLGCGPGRFLPLLSPAFRRVYAVDHSAELIAQARRSCAGLTNVQYVVQNVAALSDLPTVHLALSVNALLTPSLELQRQMLDFYAEHVRPGGTLLLVVPAFESAHLTRQMLIEWNLRDCATPDNALIDGFQPVSRTEAAEARQGVLETGGVPTKHFSQEELETLLSLRGFQVREMLKLEYPWTTEFHDPPDWMQTPGPWDWLVVARRTRVNRPQAARRPRHRSSSRSRNT
ncbi:MAG: methyltransferase domain-containing protein [Planctomycetaceae bacterium]|nr:methyltransferase domain-containing protein [Planctomycetaceae bacterium]